jgi:hypothetical protein
MEKNPETKPEMDVRQATHPWYLELIIEAVLVLFCAAIGALFIGLKVFPAGEDDFLTVTYSSYLPDHSFPLRGNGLCPHCGLHLWSLTYP